MADCSLELIPSTLGAAGPHVGHKTYGGCGITKWTKTNLGPLMEATLSRFASTYNVRSRLNAGSEFGISVSVLAMPGSVDPTKVVFTTNDSKSFNCRCELFGARK